MCLVMKMGLFIQLIFQIKNLKTLWIVACNFECNFRDVECYESSYRKNIKITFLVVLLIKLLALVIDLLSELLFIEVKIQLINLLKQFLKSINIAEM